jgi:SPP1 gp7 family putative phage head morphogenesis protein
METYEYTDKVIKHLFKRYVRLFSKAKSEMPFDELNILSYSKDLYETLLDITVKYYLKLINHVYSEYAEKPKKLTKKWLTEYLLMYDPTTKYVFMHEVERKKARFAESIVACVKANTKSSGKISKAQTTVITANVSGEVKRAMNLWAGMARQYADELTVASAVQAYKDNGAKQVMWLTMRDDKLCDECKELDGKIFDIDSVPPKPHPNCRCWLKPL